LIETWPEIEIDQAAGNEERRDAARAFLRSTSDSLSMPGGRRCRSRSSTPVAIWSSSVMSGCQPGVLERLDAAAIAEDDERIDLALVFGLGIQSVGD
jgi:hypothetical protein